jgi:hypothetical protein
MPPQQPHRLLDLFQQILSFCAHALSARREAPYRMIVPGI